MYKYFALLIPLALDLGREHSPLGTYHCTAGLQFYKFGFSCFTTYKKLSWVNISLVKLETTCTVILHNCERSLTYNALLNQSSVRQSKIGFAVLGVRVKEMCRLFLNQLFLRFSETSFTVLAGRQSVEKGENVLNNFVGKRRP